MFRYIYVQIYQTLQAAYILDIMYYFEIYAVRFLYFHDLVALGHAYFDEHFILVSLNPTTYTILLI